MNDFVMKLRMIANRLRTSAGDLPDFIPSGSTASRPLMLKRQLLLLADDIDKEADEMNQLPTSSTRG